MRFSLIKVLILLLPTVLVVFGCAHTRQLDVSYSSDPSRQSPLRTFSPLVMTVEVEDVRPKDELDVVGVIHPLGFEGGRYQTKNTARTILLESLKNELENNGHTVIPRAGREANVKIVVRIRKFWFDERNQLYSRKRIGTIRADCAILNPIDESIYGQRPVIGTFRAGTGFLKRFMTEEEVMNSALAEFIRSFSRDPEILEYLRLAQEEKKGK